MIASTEGVDLKSTSDSMRVMARTIDSFVNGDARGKVSERKIGFVLLVFPFNAPFGARTNYVSNADRTDIVTALKEIVARFEGQVDIARTPQ